MTTGKAFRRESIEGEYGKMSQDPLKPADHGGCIKEYPCEGSALDWRRGRREGPSGIDFNKEESGSDRLYRSLPMVGRTSKAFPLKVRWSQLITQETAELTIQGEKGSLSNDFHEDR